MLMDLATLVVRGVLDTAQPYLFQEFPERKLMAWSVSQLTNLLDIRYANMIIH